MTPMIPYKEYKSLKTCMHCMTALISCSTVRQSRQSVCVTVGLCSWWWSLHNVLFLHYQQSSTPLTTTATTSPETIWFAKISVTYFVRSNIFPVDPKCKSEKMNELDRLFEKCLSRTNKTKILLIWMEMDGGLTQTAIDEKIISVVQGTKLTIWKISVF